MPARRLAALGALGVVVALAAVGWAQICGARHGTQAGTYSLRVAAVLLAWLVGAAIALLAGRRGAAALAACIMLGVGLTFAFSPGSLSGRALAPPLHYGNADGAFAAAAVGAGALLVALPVWRALRIAGGVAALVFVWICVQTGSSAATAAGAAVLGVAVLAMFLPARGRRALAMLAPLVVVLATAFTIVVGASFHRGASTQPAVVRVADQVLSERRSVLWHDALVIARDHPVSGVGPGGFASTSPTARADADARWAHSAWLQQLADQGIVGLVLFAGAIGTGWWALLQRRADAVAVAGSWALGGLALQASIDYVLDFVAVPVVVALLAGVATTACRSSSGNTRQYTEAPVDERVSP